MDEITTAQQRHYHGTFRKFGAEARGVDWGPEEGARLRYDNMLAVLAHDRHDRPETPSLLDVGCGYGGLLTHAGKRGTRLNYTGIDVVADMIEHARASIPEGTFREQDLFDLPGEQRFDYVVCNGILTQKLSASLREMDRHAQRLIRTMFDHARRGIAFNVMTTKVNFMAENLYYRHPGELMSWCLAEVTSKVVLDHAYPLYEYTLYLYQEASD